MRKNYILLLGIILLQIPLLLFAQQDESSIPKGTLKEVPVQLANKIFNEKPSEIIFDENFKSGFKNWTVNGDWNISSETSSFVKTNTKAISTSKERKYANNSDEFLISPLISLKNINKGTKIYLNISETYEIESGYDKGLIKISKDNGRSWQIIGARSGLGKLRESHINLSRFAGNNIKLKFEFISDSSISYAGWFINEIKISTYIQPLALGTKITSLNSQNFPFIYMNVNVDDNGVIVNELNKSNFTITENGTTQTEYFNVVPPSIGGEVRYADIIFVLDVTGSMSEEIESVRINMNSFIDSLSISNINYNVGFVVFGDITYIYNDGNLYSQKNDILNIINNITLGENGIGSGDDLPENPLQAMADASLMNFRPGAQKVIILLTDATAHEEDSVTPLTVKALIPDLISNGVSVYPVFDTGDYEQIDQYIPIAEATNPKGSYFNIYDNFNEIINEIGSQISSTYLVSYKSSNPNFDGITRDVEVRVNYNSEQASDFAQYIPGSAPTITRTNPTIALHQQAWADGTSFDIEVEVVDNISPGVQSVTLYYKNTNDVSYQSIQMVNTSGDLYSATIPGGDVATPGLDYYITATDGISTSSDPSTNPSANPYQIAILPNVAPSITHTPVTALTVGNDIIIDATVVDNTNSLAGVDLYYRKIGQLNYTRQTMINNSGDNYTGTIPGSRITSDGIEYYIYAYDDFGVGNSSGTSDYPHVIGGKVDLSNYLVLKEDLINEFNNLGFYNNAESKAIQILNSVKNKYNIGNVTDAELENIARLYLAEYISHEALLDADQLAEISTRGLSGTIDILFYVIGKTGGFVKAIKKIPYVGKYLAWPLQKAHEGLVKLTGDVVKMFSMHVLRTSPEFTNLGWRYGKIAVSKGAKEGLDKFVEKGMEKMAKIGTEKGVFDQIHDWTKEEIFLNFYQSNTEDKLDNGVNYSLQNPFVFNENNFANAQQQFNTKLTEMNETNNKFIDWGNIVLGEAEATSDAAFFGSMVILIIAIIATIATGGTALPAAVVALLNVLPTLSLILGGVKLIDTATMVGYSNLAVPQYIEQGIDIAFDQTHNPSEAISNLKKNNADINNKLLKFKDNYELSEETKDILDELNKLKTQLNNPNTKIEEINIDKLELLDKEFNEILSINSAQIFETYQYAVDEIDHYDSLYFNSFFNKKLNYNLQYSSFYYSLAASFIEFDNMEYRENVIKYLDKLVSSINLINDEIEVIKSSLEINNISIPPLVEIISVDLPEFIEKNTQFNIIVKIKNISPIQVLGGNISLVTLNNRVKVTSETTKFSKLNSDEEKEIIWKIIPEGNDSLISCYLELLPDSNNITFSTSGRYYFNFPVDLDESPSTQGKLDNSNIYFYPNPFNPNTEEGLFRYSLASAADVTIKIYDISNNIVRTIEETGVQANTEMSATWDGKDQNGKAVSNGVYFYVIESSTGERAVGKIAVLK